jgi:hypothetical protein
MRKAWNNIAKDASQKLYLEESCKKFMDNLKRLSGRRVSQRRGPACRCACPDIFRSCQRLAVLAFGAQPDFGGAAKKAQLFWKIIEECRIAIVTPVPTVDGARLDSGSACAMIITIQ